MLSIALTTFALTVRDTPTATPALRLRGGGKLHASNCDTSRHTRRIAHRSISSLRTKMPWRARGQRALRLSDVSRVVRSGLAIDTKTLNTINSLYLGGFGLGLYLDPNAFADSGMSPLKYTADAEGPVGEFLGRAFGSMMLAMSTIGYFGPESEGALKMFAAAFSLFTPILLKNIGDESGAMKTSTWKLQVLMHLPLVVLSVYNGFIKGGE